MSVKKASPAKKPGLSKVKPLANLAKPKQEASGVRVAAKASRILKDPAAGAKLKSVAGSVLAQRDASKTTSRTVASKAAKVLQDPKSAKPAKGVAGSALTQAPTKQAKKTGPIKAMASGSRGKGTGSGGPKVTGSGGPKKAGKP